MLVLLLFIAVLLCALEYFLNYNETARMIKRIPGPGGRFLVGCLFDIPTAPVELFRIGREYAKLYKEIYQYWIYPFPSVNIFTVQDVETVLSNSKFNEKSMIYKYLKPWLQDGLLLSKGHKWLERRRILTPTFHFNILVQFTEIFDENSRMLVEKLNQRADREITLDVSPIMSEFTLHSVCETAMGTHLDNEQSNSGKSYKNAIYEIGDVVVQRFSRAYLFKDWVFNMSQLGKKQERLLNVMHNFTKRVIKERKQNFDINQIDLKETQSDDEEVYMSQKKRKVAMLDLLITAERDNLIDDRGIQEEVDTFMFEGHDTTASGLEFLLMLLANHKEIQDRVRKEITEVFGDSDRAATMKDLSKLNYLDCCVKESLRLYPPVPYISRVLPETVKLSNYTVPAGSMCHIHIYDLHRREDLFEQAETFNPDRFLPENSIGRHPYSFVPFSAGPRNCIGQKFALLEMKSAVSRLLRNFTLLPVTKISDIELKSDLVLRNNGPIYVKFVKSY